MEKLYIIPPRTSTEAVVAEANLTKPETTRSISRRFLVNKLNFLNFQDRTILVNLIHKKYGSSLSLSAIPQPCAGERLDCLWSEITDPWVIKSHTFQNLFITDGKKCLIVDPELISIDEKGISLLLPETCSESVSRKTKRQSSEGVQVQFTQSSAIFKGTLLDCSPVSFRVQVSSPSAHAFQWINSIAPVSLQLHVGNECLYSGECRIIRQTLNQSSGIFVLAPINDRIQRYKPKEFRSARYVLVPAPNAVFTHPFTGRTFNLKTIDLSGSGFSVEESAANSMLFAGMILPELELSFAQNFRIKCRAQVVYRNTNSDGENDCIVKCGLAILDMTMEDHVLLLSLLQRAGNKNSHVCTNVDMDALWNFFFETGFIYPEKYVFFQTNKTEVKRVYELLYNHNPSVARHFIHLEKGTILGHMSMVRMYENSWLIHHHAASKTESMKAGIMVLKQISYYINDLHHLQSAHLKHVFCYFRPDNKFPNRFFGGFARQLDDKAGCSLDNFAYYHYRRLEGGESRMQDSWELKKVQSVDLSELKSFYNHASGGLLIEAFDLQSAGVASDGLADEYQRLGLKKEKHFYSLYEDGELKAVFIVNVTDIGFNMTNLTNCATVILLDDDTPPTVIETALSRVAEVYEHHEMPILMYPVSYAETHSISYEKIYTLWILNLEYLDQYLKFCSTIFGDKHKKPVTGSAH